MGRPLVKIDFQYVGSNGRSNQQVVHKSRNNDDSMMAAESMFASEEKVTFF